MSRIRSADAGCPFTLTEMLAVVVIILILVSLALPAIEEAQNAALRTSCQSNMRQTGMGLAMYLNDNSYRLPSVRVLTPTASTQNGNPAYDAAYIPSGGGAGYFNSVTILDPAGYCLATTPYVKDVAVFKCPTNYSQSASSQYRNSYHYNMQHLTTIPGPSGTWPHGSAYHSSRYRQPGKYLSDFGAPGSRVVLIESIYFQNTYSGSVPDSRLPHYLGTNLLYLDGHTDWTNRRVSYWTVQ